MVITEQDKDLLLLRAYSQMGHALCDTEHWRDWARQWMDDYRDGKPEMDDIVQQIKNG